jgi:hypothetical protein
MAFDDGVKTVSGSIAHTDDAATKVPFVSVKCGIEPTMTGKSAVECTQTGKNLLPNTAQTATENGVTYTVNSDGSVSLSGTCSADTNFYIYSGFTFPKLGQYFFSGCPSGGSTSTYRVFLTNYGADIGNGYLLNVSNLSTTPSIRINIKSGVVTDGLVFKPQIEAGSTATTYEPYTAPTVSTVNLGRTIYGGTADIVNGEGQETWEKKVYTGANNEYWVLSKSGDVYRYYVINDNAKQPTGRGVVYSSIGQYSASGNEVGTCFTYYSSGINRVLIYYIPPQTIQTVEDFRVWLQSNNFDVVYEKATPTDFTFTPITPTPETVGKVNNVYCDTGDTELTYHDNAHGFSEVTVNKTGKNLFGGWTKGYGVNSTTGEIFSRQDSAISDYISVVPNTNYYISGFSNEISSMVAYYDRNKTYISRTSGSQRLSLAVTTPTNCRYMILYQYRAGDQTASIDVIDNMQTQLEFGSEQTEYEPYVVPVSKTAYLHKVIYGGQADVVRGTCEPKNILLPSNTNSASTVVNGVARSYSLGSQTWTLEGTNEKTDANWLIYNGANFVVSKALVVGDTYTYSHTLSDNCYSQFTYKDTNGTTRAIGYLVGNTNKNASVTFTIPSNFVELLRFQIGVVKTATSVSEEAVFQLEKASSKTEYAPYFDPFTFPPISMSTDEGENTLFANEGDSAITYRKAVD